VYVVSEEQACLYWQPQSVFELIDHNVVPCRWAMCVGIPWHTKRICVSAIPRATTNKTGKKEIRNSAMSYDVIPEKFRDELSRFCVEVDL